MARGERARVLEPRPRARACPVPNAPIEYEHPAAGPRGPRRVAPNRDAHRLVGVLDERRLDGALEGCDVIAVRCHTEAFDDEPALGRVFEVVFELVAEGIELIARRGDDDDRAPATGRATQLRHLLLGAPALHVSIEAEADLGMLSHLDARRPRLVGRGDVHGRPREGTRIERPGRPARGRGRIEPVAEERLELAPPESRSPKSPATSARLRRLRRRWAAPRTGNVGVRRCTHIEGTGGDDEE